MLRTVPVVQLLSHVRLFAITWTAAHQASLSFPSSQSLLKLISIYCTPFVVSDYLCLQENFTRIYGDIPSKNLPVFCLHFWNLCCCSVVNLSPALCDPVDCSTPGFPILHHLPELAQTHVHWVGDAIQPSRPLSSPSPPPSSPSPPAFSLSQHQGLF